MNDIARQVYAKLDELGIEYSSIEHEAVYTIGDCRITDLKLGGVTAKNYFLTTKNKKNFYLCLVRPEARLRTSDISKQAGSSRLSFGPEDMLEELLKTHPGAVSPMGLIFDAENRVQLLLDSALLKVEKLAFHPCDNTQTLMMRTQDFLDVFLPAVSHAPRLVEIHDFL